MANPSHQGRSSASYYKGSYEGSSKRYHLPAGVSSSLSTMHNFYDEGRKRPRTDNYGSANNGNSQTYNKEYSSGGGRGSYKSYYEGGSGRTAHSSLTKDLPSFSRREDFGRAKYVEEPRTSAPSGRLPTKSIVRRIPPPLTPPASKASLGTKKSSSDYRPIPLMHNMSGSSAGTSKEFYGSRMRQAPPEYHGHHQSSGKFAGNSSSYYQSSTYRKPTSGFVRSRLPGATNSKFVKPYTSSSHANYSSASASLSSGDNIAALRRATQKAAENVTSRIRKRAAAAAYSTPDEKRRFIRRRPIHHDGADKEKIKSKAERADWDKEEKSGEHVVEELVEDEEAAKTRRAGEKTAEDAVDGKDEEMETDLIKDIKKEKVEGEETEKAEENVSEKSDEKRKRSDSGHKSSKDGRDGRYGKRIRTAKDEEEDATFHKHLLKLHCHYCDIRCISYREFSLHLRSFAHNKLINGAVSEMRKKLSKLRTEQRDEQRKLEKSAKTLLDTTSYCRVCELNFRTDPTDHEANEVHNEIKTLIYKKCDVCNIEFRIWKVYLYHLAALEHAKRVALKELHENGDKAETVKGTNLSQEELGLDLVEQRVVFFCNACNRFIPIKGDEEEVKNRHCMTLTHIKQVDEFRERERKYAARKKEEEEKREREKKAEEAKGETSEADVNNSENKGEESAADESGEGKAIETLYGIKDEEKKGVEGEGEEEKDEDCGEEEQNEEEMENETVSENEEHDEDEIELHADDDVADDGDEEIEEARGWSRRTRSSQRKSGKRV